MDTRIARLIGRALEPTAVVALALASGIGTVAIARGGPAGQFEAPPAQGVPVAASPEGYVGVGECASCHADEARAYRASLHARVANARAPAAAHGCETCHGPGAPHVDDPVAPGRITAFGRLAPREVNAACQTCHNRQEHELWQGSQHEARNVSCISCHSLMAPASETKLLAKATVTETCAQCHRDKAAKIQRANHMPVREGKLECTTCHNQHGSTNVAMLRVGDTVNESCTSCHAEKRGPFLWEHPPVTENCATCHDPHGSSNDRLLVAKGPMLCQRCHIATRHPSTVYDATAVVSQSVRVTNRGCANCHSQVHGSNHPSGYRFQR